ncbi:MAG: hypothetical protein MUO76_17395 [Anaerolineaceae bacterium]|nr:hypothetical protein [Anaerolineaceae bacterium]
MLVPIIENWSEITAEVREIASSNIHGFHILGLSVKQVTEVNGYANMLSDTLNKQIPVHFPDEVVQDLHISVGSEISCQVRRANLLLNFVHRESVSVR